MNDSSAPSDSSSGTPRVPPVRLGRRALLRAGAGATPVLLTLASNPVSAANSCVVASSFVSVATWKSRNPNVQISCGTKTVSEWKTHCSQNPSCGTAKVKDAIGSSWLYGEKTLNDMLVQYSISTSGTLGLLQHLCAMYLSLTQTGGIKSGWSAGNLTTMELKRIWSQCGLGGNFSIPASGINWNTAQVIQWLSYQLNYPAAI